MICYEEVILQKLMQFVCKWLHSFFYLLMFCTELYVYSTGMTACGKKSFQWRLCLWGETSGRVLLCSKIKHGLHEDMLTLITHLQPVDQFFLDGVLSCGISCYSQPLCCLSEPLLLVLILRVSSRPLRSHKHTWTHMTMTSCIQYIATAIRALWWKFTNWYTFYIDAKRHLALSAFRQFPRKLWVPDSHFLFDNGSDVVINESHIKNI